MSMIDVKFIETAVHDVRTGRCERTSSVLTAAGAAITAGESGACSSQTAEHVGAFHPSRGRHCTPPA